MKRCNLLEEEEEIEGVWRLLHGAVLPAAAVDAAAMPMLPPSLLLPIQVGPREVDDELEDVVASECSKYGTVTRVLIFEITEPDFPVDEAVRISVRFERLEETTKALIDLDGRFFGGRVVCASFYDEERFGRNESAPVPVEIPGYS